MAMINIKYLDKDGKEQEFYKGGWNGHNPREFLKDHGIEFLKIISVNTED